MVPGCSFDFVRIAADGELQKPLSHLFGVGVDLYQSGSPRHSTGRAPHLDGAGAGQDEGDDDDADHVVDGADDAAGADGDDAAKARDRLRRRRSRHAGRQARQRALVVDDADAGQQLDGDGLGFLHDEGEGAGHFVVDNDRPVDVDAGLGAANGQQTMPSIVGHHGGHRPDDALVDAVGEEHTVRRRLQGGAFAGVDDGSGFLEAVPGALDPKRATKDENAWTHDQNVDGAGCAAKLSAKKRPG